MNWTEIHESRPFLGLVHVDSNVFWTTNYYCYL